MIPGVAPRLARNSLYAAVKSALSLLLLLLVMPYAVGVLGKELYGIWALAAVVTAYAQLGDFGIAESVVKYAAEYRARRDGVALNRLVNTAIVSYLALAAAIGGALWAGLPLIARDLLLIPEPLLGEAVLIFRLAVGIFFVNMVMGVFASLILATQQMGYTAVVNVVSALLGALGTVVLLWQGFGLRGLLLTHGLVALVAGVMNLWFARRLFPELSLRPWRWGRVDTFREIVGYSWKAQTSNLAQQLIFQVDRILLSRYLGLEAVTYYEIGSTAALYARTFVVSLFSPMMPAASDLHARGERQLLPGLYRRAFKFAVLVAVPCFLLGAGLAYPFVSCWMGAGFELSALTLQLLLPVYLLNVLTAPGVFLLNGMGRPELAMKAAVLAGLANLALCLILVKVFGYYGLIAGITLALTISTLYFGVVLHRALPELSPAIYPATLFKPLFFCVPLAVILHFQQALPGTMGLPGLLLLALSAFAIVAVLLFKSNYLDEYERMVLTDAFGCRRSSLQPGTGHE